MFLTLPSFEQWAPESLGPAGARYWAAMTLSSGLHWYLLTHRFVSDGGPVAQTLAVSWESTLRSFLDELGDSVVALHVVVLAAQASGWRLRRVAEVWASSPDEEGVRGPLLLRLEGDADLVDSHLRRTADASPRRTCLVRLPPG